MTDLNVYNWMKNHASFIFQIRGTNSVNWGGLATLGVTRHVIFTSFSFEGSN
jgi:hypothetical protein